MKKTILSTSIFLLLIFKAADASNSLSFSYSFPKAEIIQNIEGHKIIVNGLEDFHADNLPLVPVRSLQIIMPPGSSFDSIIVVSFDKCTLTVPSFLMTPKSFPNQILNNGSSKFDIYPANNALKVATQWKRGIQILLVNIFPVLLQIEKQKLIASRQIDIKVHYHHSLAKSISAIRCDPKSINFAENPEVLEQYFSNTNKTLSKINGTGICNPADSFPYVIITSDSIKNANVDYSLDSLLAHRSRQGVPGKIVTTEEIYPAYSGIDKQEKLRNFIRDAYNKWETEYILLAGDTNVIPPRYVMPNGYFAPTDNVDPSHIPTDAYYSCLDGGFNRDGDTCWAEATDGDDSGMVDLIPDIYVGRFSGSNARKISNQVYKTLKFERTPGDAAWMSRALFVGESLGFGGVSQYADSSLDELRFGASKPYTTVGFNSYSRIQTVPLYESPGVTVYNSQLLLRIMRDSFQVYVSYGHSYPSKIMKLLRTDTANFGIKQQCFPFLFSEGCESGAFDYVGNDCIAETFTTATRRGFAVILANSRVAYAASNNTDGAIHRFARRFWHSYFADTTFHLGAMLAYTRESNAATTTSFAMRHCHYTMTLFGDPYTRIRMRGENDVAIEEHSLSAANALPYLAVSPSPFQGSGTIKAFGFDKNKNVTVTIYNVLGKKVFAKTIRSASLNIKQTLPAGVYTVRVSDGKKIATTKWPVVR